MTPVFAYYRVSTARQGGDGLGMAAQREAVARYCASVGAVVAGEFTEVESGRDDSRPELAKAIVATRRLKGAKLVIAKLDRLSRRVSFISRFMESGIDFAACDLPGADKFRLHLEACIAEEETATISARTRAALAAARERGVKFGAAAGGHCLDRADSLKGAAVQAAAADARAREVLPVLEALRGMAGLSLAAMAAELNRRGVPTARGATWHASSVRNVLNRAV